MADSLLLGTLWVTWFSLWKRRGLDRYHLYGQRGIVAGPVDLTLLLLQPTCPWCHLGEVDPQATGAEASLAG